MSSDLYASNVAAYPSGYEATQGDKAPLFIADSILNNHIQRISLNDFQGKWVLLFFYPSDFTFV